MKRHKRNLSILLVAIMAFILGPILWPQSHEVAHASDIERIFFMAVSVVESIGFAIGISFLIDGWSLVKRIPKEAKGRILSLYFSVGWLLVNWWPHDNLHQMIGSDTSKLLLIELGFHLTSITAAFIISLQILHYMREYLNYQNSRQEQAQ